MKFLVARTRLQQDHLDSFFESFTLTRNASTKEWTVHWRPWRFCVLFFGLGFFFYFGTAAAVTFWIQSLEPGIRLDYNDVANPLHWSRIPDAWRAYSSAYVPTLESGMAKDAKDAAAKDAVARAAARVTSGGTGQGSTVYSVADNPLVAGTPYGPLLTQYFTHNGGAQKLLGIFSIQIHGTVTMESGTILNFTMIKKPPAKVRINMHNGLSNSEATVVSDGRSTWKWTGDPYLNGARPAPQEEIAALIRESFYCNLPVEIIHNPHALREIPRALGEDEHYNYVQTLLGDGMRALIFLNPDTWRADRIQIDYDQGGIPCTYTIVVRDWMTVEGIAEPALIDVYVNGSHLLKCQFDSITYNPGAYDVLFQPPADLPKTPAAPPPQPAAATPAS
jgi:hypothetical protein